MNRRQFLTVTSSAAVGAIVSSSTSFAQTAPSTAPASQPGDVPDNLAWHDVRDWGLEGRAFDDTESYFDRLPGRAKNIVRDAVWSLSHHTAGLSTRFETDATSLYLRYEVLNATLAMPHMAATGVSGVDVYGMTEHGWNWLTTHQPKSKVMTARIISGVLPGKRQYLLNLPLYNGVVSMQIGVAPDADFIPTPPRKARPILFYGTSITQGGCASRPGMAFTNILGRRLNVPMLNFGFSGNGRMELEVAQFLDELDPCVFVNDCMANTTLEQVRERVAPMTRLFRNSHPSTPILFVEDRIWSNAPLMTDRDMTAERKTAFRDEFNKLVQAGVEKLHYKTGDELLGIDSEGTVDGSHPNDLGMARYADALEPTLRSLL